MPIFYYNLDRNPKEKSILEKTFLRKSIPILLIGLLIWMSSTIIFGGTILSLNINLPLYIFLIIIYFILWIILILSAINGYNIASMILFFITSYITGIIESPIIIWAGQALENINLAILLFLYASIFGVVSTTFALLFGYIYRERLQRMKGLWIILFTYGLIVIIIEIILGFFYEWNSYILITSAFVLIWIFGTIIYDGSQLDRFSEDEWMIITLTIFIDLIIVIGRIFILLVSILAKNKDD